MLPIPGFISDVSRAVFIQCFFRKPLSEESGFCFRRGIYSHQENDTPVPYRKQMQILENNMVVIINTP